MTQVIQLKQKMNVEYFCLKEMWTYVAIHRFLVLSPQVFEETKSLIKTLLYYSAIRFHGENKENLLLILNIYFMLI